MLVKVNIFKGTVKHSVNGVITPKARTKMWLELNWIGRVPGLFFFIGLKYLSMDQNQNHLLVTRSNDNHPLEYCWINLLDNLTPQHSYVGRAKRICYLSPMRAAKVQANLRIRAVSPEPSLLAHRKSESRGTFRQKARSLAPLNGWACAVEICHDGMLEDTNSLDGAYVMKIFEYKYKFNS